jgi:hypothetical protein
MDVSEQLHTPAALTLLEKNVGSHEQVSELASEPVWTPYKI